MQIRQRSELYGAGCLLYVCIQLNWLKLTELKKKKTKNRENTNERNDETLVLFKSAFGEASPALAMLNMTNIINIKECNVSNHSNLFITIISTSELSGITYHGSTTTSIYGDRCNGPLWP